MLVYLLYPLLDQLPPDLFRFAIEISVISLHRRSNFAVARIVISGGLVPASLWSSSDPLWDQA